MAEPVPKLLQALWQDFGFSPNSQQRDAVLHVNGPLFLPAGPGSGKTKVLLWRTINLITQHGVAPDEIYLSTFTEKAALQLRNGLRTLLSAVSAKTGKQYDTARLYVGTVHSLCQRLLTDRRISPHRSRTKLPVLLDELDQYLFLTRGRNWKPVLDATAWETPADIIRFFGGKANATSKHEALTNLISFFNRLSEETIDPAKAKSRASDAETRGLLEAYATYRELLAENAHGSLTDLSLIQSVAVEHLRQNPSSIQVFRHVIVDEYQDTNPVQEHLFFQLAAGHKNICVVGDDDQALYRFRGATVENFVDFPERCEKRLGVSPRQIVLATNYRSREDIVGFYNRFIVSPCCDWKKPGKGAYRVMEKKIIAHRKEQAVAVVASSPGKPADVAAEIAQLVRRLLDGKKVEDASQIAFLFPSVKSDQAKRMMGALHEVGLKTYAPRAGVFLGVDEAKDVFGLISQTLGQHEHRFEEFALWQKSVHHHGAELMEQDSKLASFIAKRRSDIQQASDDYSALATTMVEHGWSETTHYDPATMPAVLAATTGLSARARKTLRSGLFNRFAQQRMQGGKPFTLGYVVSRASSLDWNLLDFFYQLTGFKHFKAMFDLAESGKDEGPVCNLSLVSQYLSRFLDQFPFTISGESLANDRFLILFTNFLYVLYRRGESEYENAEDPFPKGRIPFITIHQSKGLEFPVVILGNPRKDPKLQAVEKLVKPLLTRTGEPMDRMAEFDVMRMFYVALSRAKNLLVVAHFQGQGQRMHDAFKDLLDSRFPRIPDLRLKDIPAAKLETEDLPQSYSYTGDYLLYQRCPRQYMLFRKYAFAPARSLTMFFGSLVHQTIEDLHHRLIDQRKAAR
jgi:DNA helicase-2/ATP-dependent DNA helicase PcrA